MKLSIEVEIRDDGIFVISERELTEEEKGIVTRAISKKTGKPVTLTFEISETSC